MPGMARRVREAEEYLYPKNMQRRFTEQQLRVDLAAGLTPVDIAAKYGVTPHAVRTRIQRTRRHHAKLSHSADEPLAVSRQAAVDELLVCHHRARLLQDACDAWLRDPDNPDRYHLAPRAEEITVIYTETGPDGAVRRAKSSLAALLARVDSRFHVESASHLTADPRDLLLKTLMQARGLIAATGGVAQQVADSRAAQLFQTAVLNAIESASPETADAIKAAIRRADITPNPDRLDVQPEGPAAPGL